MKHQAYNPFLPLWEYIPDGEPHVFGDRLYLFGSHDVEGGERYCAAGNYVGWSAPLDDLSDWRYEGVLYTAAQDPRSDGALGDLYAPDVVRGNDGRYYLYYGLSGGIGVDDHNTAIGVAVCDTPAGKYEYYGFVRNPDGSPYLRYLPADPAVINDGGVIRLYHGWGLSMVAAGAHSGEQGRQQAAQMPDFAAMGKDQIRQFLLGVEQMLFHRSKEQLLAEPEDVMGANHVTLADDMLTVTSEPARILPSQFLAFGTSFRGYLLFHLLGGKQQHALLRHQPVPGPGFRLPGHPAVQRRRGAGRPPGRGPSEHDRQQPRQSRMCERAVVYLLPPADTQLHLQPPSLRRTSHDRT